MTPRQCRNSQRDDSTVRVWILNHYAVAPDRPGGTRHYSLAKAVVDAGGEATVFAADFSHARGVSVRLQGRRLVRNEHVDGVRFTWVRTLPYFGNTWRRVLNMASYALVVTMVEVGRPRPDVVVGSTVHPLAALAGWFIARRRGARYVYEVRDLWPQTMIEIGELRPASMAARWLWALEAFCTRQADVVLTVLPGMATYLRSRGLPADHVRYLPNGPNLKDFDSAADHVLDGGGGAIRPLLDDVQERRRRGEVVFVYAGSHGLVNRLETIVDAIEELEKRTDLAFHVLFVGDGPEKAKLESRARAKGLRSVRFSKPVVKTDIPALLRSVDIGLLHYTSTPVYRYGISFNKVFDYMAAGIPIVFACTAVNDPVAASGAGVSVAPDDPKALADAMAALARVKREERQSMGAQGRAWVEQHHDMARLSARFLAIIGMNGAAGQPADTQEAVPSRHETGAAG